MKQFVFALFFCSLIFGSPQVFAQDSTKRVDHLTVEEDDLVRETRTIEQRVEVFVAALDRRFQSLGAATQIVDKKKEKFLAKFGALPTGTRAELLADVSSIVAEAIVKIDDVAERDPKDAQLPKALKILADGCSRFMPQLKTLDVPANTRAERAAIADSTQNCSEIVEAHRKHSAAAIK